MRSNVLRNPIRAALMLKLQLDRIRSPLSLTSLRIATARSLKSKITVKGCHRRSSRKYLIIYLLPKKYKKIRVWGCLSAGKLWNKPPAVNRVTFGRAGRRYGICDRPATLIKFIHHPDRISHCQLFNLKSQISNLKCYDRKHPGYKPPDSSVQK
jgi:hypothetical protein